MATAYEAVEVWCGAGVTAGAIGVVLDRDYRVPNRVSSRVGAPAQILVCAKYAAKARRALAAMGR